MKNGSYLSELESRSVYIIREAYAEYGGKLAFLWSMGKDSTVLIHMARKAFLGELPVPVVHIDTGFKFKKIYGFRDKWAKKWNLDLIVAKNNSAVKKGMAPYKGRFLCCNTLKTIALKQILKRHDFRAVFVAIRRDEHMIRAKERYFSPRKNDFRWDYNDQPLELWAQYYQTRVSSGSHFRVHPLLHWREIDIWRYIKMEKIPVIDLYFAFNNRRYRSIGCECCCEAVDSSADTIEKIISELENTFIAERAGRAQDKEKEYMMQKLRSLGYM